MRWTGHVASKRMRNVYHILVGKPEGKRPLPRPRQRWEDNMRMGLRVRWEVWNGLMWNRTGLL